MGENVEFRLSIYCSL